MSEPICIQTGITCGFPCWHKCPRYDEVKGKNFNQPSQCEQAAVSGECKHEGDEIITYGDGQYFKRCADCGESI